LALMEKLGAFVSDIVPVSALGGDGVRFCAT
jgi:hypothetical protein